RAIQQGILAIYPKAQINVYPVSDGGEGFCKAIQHYTRTKTILIKAKDPLFRTIKAAYEWDKKKRKAFIELAAASGLAHLAPAERDPLQTSTWGTGQLIQHALAKGAREIILGMGGSATHDGGMGIAGAMGFVFLDVKGRQVFPTGKALSRVHTILPPGHIPKVKFTICHDVQNKLCGKQGAAVLFAPQKGASRSAVTKLDEGLSHLALLLKKITGKNFSRIEGLGAAGGAALLLTAFFPTHLSKGSEWMIRTSQLRKSIQQADWIISGEGKIDPTTFQGKIAGEINRIAYRYRKNCVLFCGRCDSSLLKKNAVIQPLATGSVSQEKAMREAAALLRKKARLFFSKIA
ncbi:MAG: glycerate kinase, partial [Chitinophagaceae bacterium]